MAEHTEGQGRYLFAVGRGFDREALLGLSGLRGSPLDVVEHVGLQAVVCSVDLQEFGEAALPQNLEDMSWLEEVARTHNNVVFAVSEIGTAAPMRLVTIYDDDASVRSRLEELEAALTTALDRIEGRREWAVKVYTAVAEGDVGTPVEAVSSPQGASPGAAYLDRKREQVSRRQAAATSAAHSADEIYDALGRHAVASRRLPPQDPRLTGRSDPMTLNAAYLIDSTEGKAFREVVRRVDEVYPGCIIEVEGPWPPYSFATLE